MRRLKTPEIFLVGGTAGEPLERDEVGEGADRSRHAVNTALVRAREQTRQVERGTLVGDEVDQSMARPQVKRPSRAGQRTVLC